MRGISLLIICLTVNADVMRVIDGDTFIASIAIWHNLTIIETVRVLGVDTPELHSGDAADRIKATAAKEFTAKWLGVGPVALETCKRDAFGRSLATITKGGVSLADELIRNGHGKLFRP